MIRIRLARVGKKGRPSYRIVVADIAAPRDGSYLEWIGNYDPMQNPPAVTLKTERAAHWLSMGAIPSDAVARIMDANGLMERTPTQKTATKKSGEEESSAPAAVATPARVAAAVEAPEEEAAPVEAPVEEASAEETAEEEAPAEEPAAEEASAEEEPEAEEEAPADEEAAE
ncbi:MAG TPA: 30S ribosomal protein S16 [Dehalococcoidia bacterium]|nr:30S ribosomal protein S16 [Dehalococcoidia bacterium]